MEEWRPVIGYEGYYEVSNLGRVRSVERYVNSSRGQHMLPQRMKRPSINQDGYAIVGLSKNGKTKKFGVHRLVFEAFCGQIPCGCEINHKDFDRTNNAVENLEAITHTENILYTVSAGRNYTSINDTRGERNPNYGNKKLSERYYNDPDLSRRKQGRPGKQNGRARPIRAVYPDGTIVDYNCVVECVHELIASGISSGTPQNVYARIWKSIKDHKTYRNIMFQYI